jgi:RNA polymerase sigma factor (sigma-70 family)
MSQSDEDLMEAYVRGDGRAFETLFARWAPKLSAFFARALGHGATSDDVLQVTFLKIHAAKDTFRLGAPFRPWLYGIASRCRADELRKRYRTRKNVADGDLSDVQVASDAPDVGENNELVRRVRRAIEALPEAQRSVVLLHRYEGLTFGEIAEALSIAEGKPVQEGAVRVRAFRAYETLRAALADMRDGLDSRPSNGERT